LTMYVITFKARVNFQLWKRKIPSWFWSAGCALSAFIIMKYEGSLIIVIVPCFTDIQEYIWAYLRGSVYHRRGQTPLQICLRFMRRIENSYSRQSLLYALLCCRVGPFVNGAEVPTRWQSQVESACLSHATSDAGRHVQCPTQRRPINH